MNEVRSTNELARCEANELEVSKLIDRATSRSQRETENKRL
jgi:hypothetical protein